MNDLFREADLMMTRRQLFGRTALGLGTAAMAGLMGREAFGAPAEFKGGIHHVAKAKRVIYLFMSGGPSHLDLWDYKPKMREMYGKDLPKEVRDGQRITGMTSRQKTLPVCPTKYKFTKQENNDGGVWVSELLPHTSTVTKELCVAHTTFTEAINHDPAITYIQSGSQIPGRPSLGSWLSYGLGSMNENLPSYVVMHARTKHPEQSLIPVNTRNILFICGGSFESLEGIIARRVGKTEIGFGGSRKRQLAESQGILSLIKPQDLIEFGYIPELIGRLPVVTTLDSLSESELYEVMISPKNSLVKQYQKLFRMEGIELEFSEDALKTVISKAYEHQAGARGLRSVLEKAMMDIMYHIPEMDGVHKIIITKDVIEKNKSPLYRRRRKSA